MGQVVVMGVDRTGFPPSTAGFSSNVDPISSGEAVAVAPQQRVAATALPKSRRVGSAFMVISPVQGAVWLLSIVEEFQLSTIMFINDFKYSRRASTSPRQAAYSINASINKL